MVRLLLVTSVRVIAILINMGITREEAELYARLTLKQWKVADTKVTFHDILDNSKCNLGQYVWADDANEIRISNQCLEYFPLFEWVLKHELAHKLDYDERGTFYDEKGKLEFHGKSFKKWCKVVGITNGRFPPRRLLNYD